MTSREALEEIKDLKIVRLHDTSLPEMMAPIDEYFKEQTSIIEKDLDKLSQLEEIEKELGIDLITLFKALKNGIWVKNEFGQRYRTNVYLYDLSLSSSSNENRFCFLMNNKFLLFSALKQTWALTKKELENEKL